MSNQRVVFYCNAIDETIRAARGITTDSPAATRKVLGVARALQAAGCNVMVASMGRGRVKGRLDFHPASTRSESGIVVRYGPTVSMPGVSEVLSVGWLLWTAIRASLARETVHLFYNQFIAYLPALAWLRLLRARTVTDIEDGQIDRETQATLPTRGNASPPLFARFVSGGALLACRKLASSTTIRPVLPCYGALNLAPAPNRSANLPLVVMLSGLLSEGTGSDLLLAALRHLVESRDNRLRRLSIEVAGFGPGLTVLSRAAADPALQLTVHGRLNASAYSALLDRAAVGLSLKTHSSAYADTTFPSKVMEYAERAQCLIATDISDVRHVFGETARYLTSDDPKLLAAELAWAADNPTEVLRRGREARLLVEGRFTEAAVGRELRDFLFPSLNKTQ